MPVLSASSMHISDYVSCVNQCCMLEHGVVID